jgi:hypothetical protein
MPKLIHSSIGLYRADKASQHDGQLFVNITELDEFGGRNSKDVLVSSLLAAKETLELEKLYERLREKAGA